MTLDEKKSKLCKQCFACCKVTYLPIDIRCNDDVVFYLNKGIDLRLKNGFFWAIIKGDCPHLTKNGCDIYSIRSEACRVYDGRKDMFTPEMCLWLTLGEEE